VAIRNDLVYKDECYQIIGLIYEVYNDIGFGHKEKFYQNAVENSFIENKIPFKRELKAKVVYKNKDIGYNFFDFLVFDKIVLELKQRNYFSKKDFGQLYAYLKVMNLKLGLLVYFTKSGIKYRRIVNLK
jgi:GxxExxY protein